MAILTPDATYQMCGVTVKGKIIPDGTRWTDASKAVKAGFSANALYKAQKPLCGTGKAKFVTIHNTADLANVYDDGEQYTRATWPNQNMGSSRVHFYVDDTGAWQTLKAGTGLCPADPEGKAEVGWHAGDGSVVDGGNMTSLSIEIIMGEGAEHDAIARDNGARIAAWLLWKHGLTIDKLVTHTYWVNKSAGKTFADADTQCTNPISGKKWCPTYIFGSSAASTAKKNWQAFKAVVADYLVELNGANVAVDVNYQGKVNAAVGLNCRASPNKCSQSLKTYQYGTVLTITKEQDGWGYTGEGWVSLSYIDKVATAPAPTPATTPAKQEDDDMISYKNYEDVPSWYQPAVKKAMDKGALKGDENGHINASEDLCRTLTILDRLGKLD